MLGFKNDAKDPERIGRPKMIRVVEEIKIYIKPFLAKDINNISCLFNVL